MRKKQIANLVMVVIIVLIVVAGVLGVGYIRGWFDTADGTYAVLNDIRGTVNLERDGVSYPAEGETVLRTGDKLTCDPGATAVIRAGGNMFTIGEKASLRITDPVADHFSAELLSGEVFANCENTAVMTFSGKKAAFFQATALLSVRAGAQSVSVLRGQVGNASAGQILNYVGDEESIGKLDIHSLNDFSIAQIREYDGSVSLCFTIEDLDLLMAERQEALQELINGQTQPTTPGTETTAPEQTEPTAETTTQSGTGGETQPTQPGNTTPTNPGDPTTGTQTPETETTDPIQTTTPPETTVPPTTEEPTEPPVTEKPTEPPVNEKPTEPPVTEKPTEPPVTEKPTEPPDTEVPTEPPVTEIPTESPTTMPETTPPASGGGSCTITIRCDTILNNMDDLEPGKAEFVPGDGVILYPVTVEFERGETVFDVLKRVCDIAGIQLEYSWTPLYDSYYIEGINHLYEFDCGNESGWMYKVNGWFPNYGCSSYTLKDGDVIVWAYTCHGWGTDVGAPEWTG